MPTSTIDGWREAPPLCDIAPFAWRDRWTAGSAFPYNFAPCALRTLCSLCSPPRRAPPSALGVFLSRFSRFLSSSSSPLSLLLFGSSETRARMLLDTTVNEDGAIFCSHCEMWLNGPTQWEDHKIGTKHKKRVRQEGTRLGWVRKLGGVEGARHTSPAADLATRDDSFSALGNDGRSYEPR